MAHKEEKPKETPWKSIYKPTRLPDRTMDRETIIEGSRQILERGIIERPRGGQRLLDYTEDLRDDIERRKFAVRQLGKLGETDYLIRMKTRYDIALENARKLLERTTNEKLQASIQVGAMAYGQLRKQIPDEEWGKLSKIEQDRMIREVGVQGAVPVIARYDAEIRKLEDRIGVLGQVIAEIEKVLPPPTKDSLF